MKEICSIDVSNFLNDFEKGEGPQFDAFVLFLMHVLWLVQNYATDRDDAYTAVYAVYLPDFFKNTQAMKVHDASVNPLLIPYTLYFFFYDYSTPYIVFWGKDPVEDTKAFLEPQITLKIRINWGSKNVWFLCLWDPLRFRCKVPGQLSHLPMR